MPPHTSTAAAPDSPRSAIRCAVAELALWSLIAFFGVLAFHVLDADAAGNDRFNGTVTYANASIASHASIGPNDRS